MPMRFHTVKPKVTDETSGHNKSTDPSTLVIPVIYNAYVHTEHF